MKSSYQSIILLSVGGLLIAFAAVMGTKFRLTHASQESRAVPPDIRMRVKIGGQRFSLYQYPRGSLSLMG